MPRRPLRPCSHPGCPELVARGPCPRHARQREQARGSRHERGYDADHERWRKQILQRDPVCTYCHAAPSTDADHIIPIRDAPHRRLDLANGRGACNPCHMRYGEKSRSGRTPSPRRPYIPSRLRPSRIPLTLVCGPPASGKSTWVAERASPADLVIDLDLIRAELDGVLYDPDTRNLGRALDARDHLLRQLGTCPEWPAAWFIVGAPTTDERSQWAHLLRPVHVEVLATPLDECFRRIDADDRRADIADDHKRAVLDWWDHYDTVGPYPIPSLLPPVLA